MATEKLIPAITDDELIRYAHKIKPLVRNEKGKLYQIKVEFTNDFLRYTAFTWDPVLIKPASTLLYKIKTIRTLHTYGYHGLFKPDVSEVIAQIPKDIIDLVVGFELTDTPKTAEDLNRESEMTNKGYHVSNAVLYATN